MKKIAKEVQISYGDYIFYTLLVSLWTIFFSQTQFKYREKI